MKRQRGERLALMVYGAMGLLLGVMSVVCIVAFWAYMHGRVG